jgi:hypothetical protein
MSKHAPEALVRGSPAQVETAVLGMAILKSPRQRPRLAGEDLPQAHPRHNTGLEKTPLGRRWWRRPSEGDGQRKNRGRLRQNQVQRRPTQVDQIATSAGAFDKRSIGPPYGREMRRDFIHIRCPRERHMKPCRKCNFDKHHYNTIAEPLRRHTPNKKDQANQTDE